LTTLMRPSDPVRHFWPLRNQRFLCSRLRSRAFGQVVGNAYAFDAFHLRGGLVPCGVERWIGCDQARRASHHRLMRLNGGDQQVGIMRPPSEDLVIGDDLNLGLL
jgi:hypothetical protein